MAKLYAFLPPSLKYEYQDPPSSYDQMKVHALLERLAQEAEVVALNARDQIIAATVAEFETDTAGFSFDCNRWGDSLRVSIARSNNPVEPRFEHDIVYPQLLRRLIPMADIRGVQIIDGHGPDTRDYLRYSFWHIAEGGFAASHPGNEMPTSGAFEAFPKLPTAPHGRRLFRVQPEPQDIADIHGLGAASWQGLMPYEIDFMTAEFPRFAKDDEILLDGVGSLFMPAGQGRSAYERIQASIQ